MRSAKSILPRNVATAVLGSSFVASEGYKGRRGHLCVACSEHRKSDGLFGHQRSLKPNASSLQFLPRPCLPPTAKLEFITDVEGNWEYLRALVARSDVLSWRADDDTLLELADGAYFVFGGDVPDKGPGDIRVTRALVKLQRQHPDRVFLIVGNRDCNKLRLTAELAEGEFPDVDPVSYLDAHGWQGPKQQYAEYIAERHLQRDRFSAFRWIAEKTLGGADILRSRSSELELLGLPASEEDVIRSYVDQVDPAAPEPWTLEYLRSAQIMTVIGDCLFVHGAVLSSNLLLVPAEEICDGSVEMQPPPLRLPDATPIEAWAADLNDWKARQVRLFEAFPRFQPLGSGGSARWRGGEPLMMPSLSGCRVVTDGFLRDGNGAALDADVAAYLARNGIRRVFSGHQPQGQSPGVTRCVEQQITVLVADTSFSDVSADKAGNPANNRGVALSSVEVTDTHTTVRGVLADGTAHGYVLHVDWERDDVASSLIGRQFSDMSWGRTVIGGQVQTCYGQGFRLTYLLLDPHDALARLSSEYTTSSGSAQIDPLQRRSKI